MSGSVFSKGSLRALGFWLCCHGAVACTGVSSNEGGGQGGDGNEAGSPGNGGNGGDDQGDQSGGGGANGAQKFAGTTWRRLTAAQLNNSLADLFGTGLAAGAPDPDIREHNFLSIGAALTNTSSGGVEKLQTLSHELAEKIALDPNRRKLWFACDPKTDFGACVSASLKKLGVAMFRQPLPNETLAGLLALAEQAKTSFGDPWIGVQYALAAMMQSPRFFYIQEKVRGDAKPGESVALDGYSVASRLSFLLWNTTPDAELLAAADKGELDSDSGIETQTTRLLQSPRAKQGFREFFASAWGIHKAANRSFDVEAYPMLAATVGASALEEALRFIETHIIDGGKPLGQALLSNETFVNRDVAPIYGLPALPGPAYAKTTLPASAKRHGFFTHTAFLIANSTPIDTQPMLRGRTVRENLLCQQIPDPPANLMAQLPPLEPGKKQTKRERLAVHREDPFCASCHDPIDPPGLALENYDAAGFHRSSEDGLAIDAKGDLDGAAFDNPEGFVKAIIGHPAFYPCFVTNLYRHATAHVETADEEEALATLANEFVDDQANVPRLLSKLTRSRLFTHGTMPAL
ncbi:MAG: DUF1592 domain-containing protein [Deltaproteobacteria bacterium]|nr:DUF1592 domain-containing protein [Deltaproteobacteria bacterium]